MLWNKVNTKNTILLMILGNTKNNTSNTYKKSFKNSLAQEVIVVLLVCTITRILILTHALCTIIIILYYTL